MVRKWLISLIRDRGLQVTTKGRLDATSETAISTEESTPQVSPATAALSQLLATSQVLKDRQAAYDQLSGISQATISLPASNPLSIPVPSLLTPVALSTVDHVPAPPSPLSIPVPSLLTPVALSTVDHVPAPPSPPKEVTASLVYGDYLYVGPFRAAINPAFLHAHGITDVLSVGVRTSPRPAYRVQGVTYHEVSALLRLHDRSESSILEDCVIDEAVAIIGQVARSERESHRRKRKILVHCAKGISRSPTIAIGYLIMHERLSASEAYLCVKGRRPAISPRSNFLSQLLELERIVHGVELF